MIQRKPPRSPIRRYLFNRPFNFSVEFTELSIGLIVYLGVGLTTHENGHVRVDVLTLRLGERVRATVDAATALIALGFLAVLAGRLSHGGGQRVPADRRVPLALHGAAAGRASLMQA